MRKSKKNITKRHKTTKKKCVYTDEAKRLMKIIKYFKKHRTTRKNKTT